MQGHKSCELIQIVQRKFNPRSSGGPIFGTSLHGNTFRCIQSMHHFTSIAIGHLLISTVPQVIPSLSLTRGPYDCTKVARASSSIEYWYEAIGNTHFRHAANNALASSRNLVLLLPRIYLSFRNELQLSACLRACPQLLLLGRNSSAKAGSNLSETPSALGSKFLWNDN